MGMKTALEKVESCAEPLIAGAPGSKRRFTDKMKVLQKRLQHRYPTRAASVDLDDRYVLAFMRWGTEKPLLWVLDTQVKQVQRPNQFGDQVRAMVCDHVGDIIYALDEEGIFTFLEGE